MYMSLVSFSIYRSSRGGIPGGKVGHILPKGLGWVLADSIQRRRHNLCGRDCGKPHRITTGRLGTIN